MTATRTETSISEEDLLRLQRMESKLVEALVAPGDGPSRSDEARLRYGLSLAMLDVFEPGAAARGGRSGRGDVRVRSRRLGAWRRSVLDALEPALLTGEPEQRIASAVAALRSMGARLDAAREQIATNHADDFHIRDLDREVGTKSLVTIGGGGGGAAYVYIGAWEVLEAAGLVPAYIIGASMGAILGLFRARRKQPDFAADIRVAKSLRSEDVFRFVSFRRRYGLPGITRLFLHAGIGSAFVGEDGAELKLGDLEIPFDAVVAGIRRGAMDESPEEYASSHHLHEDQRPSALEMRAQLALQLTRLVDFINPKVVQEIVLGADSATRELCAVDAAGFSGAIPGILHYDVTRDDPRTHEILEGVMDDHGVTALVDGGVANNVPVRTAWRAVRNGRIGTRNCAFLAFDCFHPQWGLGHVWLQPVTRAIAYQVAANERYAHQRIEFHPTLSPINLVPRARAIDRAIGWGHDQMQAELAPILKLCERVTWVPAD